MVRQDSLQLKKYRTFTGTVLIAAMILTALSASSADAGSPGDRFTNSQGMKFVWVPAGTFFMGSPPNELGRDDDETLHRVTLSKGFYIGITEVTQGQWQKVMGDDPAGFRDMGADGPVEQVSWDDCQAFIKKLNRLEKTRSYRLPTEAEWEYACRAGSRTAFCDGDITEISCALQADLDAVAWYCANSGLRSQPVATKKPNAWGIHDMHGNVQEWCLDQCEWRSIWSRRTGVINDTYRNNIVDPVSKKGTYRIFRGGSWNQSSKYARSADRNFFRPNARRTYIGFRVVKAD